MHEDIKCLDKNLPQIPERYLTSTVLKNVLSKIMSCVAKQFLIIHNANFTQSFIALQLGVNQSVVQRCLARFKETGSFSARRPLVSQEPQQFELTTLFED